RACQRATADNRQTLGPPPKSMAKEATLARSAATGTRAVSNGQPRRIESWKLPAPIPAKESLKRLPKAVNLHGRKAPHGRPIDVSWPGFTARTGLAGHGTDFPRKRLARHIYRFHACRGRFDPGRDSDRENADHGGATLCYVTSGRPSDS